MFYTNMVPINFRANFIKNVSIPHKISDNDTKMTDVAIVELDVTNKNDVQAIEDISLNWERKSPCYAKNIYNEVVNPRRYSSILAKHFYAVTTQNNDFDKLDSDKILGISVYTETKSRENELNWLQVEPSNNYNNAKSKRLYKNIGTTLVDFVKNITQKPLTLVSSEEATPFYEKQNFRRKAGYHPLIMFWGGY